MKKRQYILPVVEWIALESQWPVLISGSGEHGAGGYGHAPRRDPVF